jgi:hypothetical protein
MLSHFYLFSSVLGPPETPKRCAPFYFFLSFWLSWAFRRPLGAILAAACCQLAAHFHCRAAPGFPKCLPGCAKGAPKRSQSFPTSLPTSIPKASRKLPEGLPKAFRAAKLPRRDARSVYDYRINVRIANFKLKIIIDSLL